MRLPDPIANTTTEAYLAYKAGVLSEGDLKPKLYDPYIHLDAWLAHWAGLTYDYPLSGIGKNLCMPLESGFYDIVTGKKNDAAGGRTQMLIPVVPGRSYIFSTDGNGLAMNVLIYDFNREYKGVLGSSAVAAGDSFKIPEGIGYIAGARGGLAPKVQLEEGNTITAYEPYTGEPEMLTDEEALIAYLSGVTNTYPEEFRDPADVRVAAYLKYLVSARWGRPEYPVTNEELYLSMMDAPYIPAGEPSSDIEIDDTAEAPFKDVKMYGDTSQQTYTGKNLFNKNANTGAFRASKSVSGEEITITSTSAGNGYVAFVIPNSNDLLGKTCTISIKNITASVSGAKGAFAIYQAKEAEPATVGGFVTNDEPTGQDYSKTFTFPGSFSGSSNCFAILLYPNSLGGSISVGDNTKYSNIQIEAGSTATTYEPYVGGVPAPNPDYPQAVNTVTGRQVVKVEGKNIYNPASATSSGANHQNIRFTTPLSPSTQYTFNVTDSRTYAAVYLYNSEGTKTRTIGNAPISHTITFTTSSAEVSGEFDFYASPNVDVSTYDFTGVQLELGSTATTYEPYQGQDYEINLGKNLFDAANANVKTGYILNDSGTEVSDNTGGYTRNYSVVEPNTTYTISGLVNAGTRRIYYYDGAKNFISRSDGSGASSWQFTTPANCHFINVQIYTNRDNATAMAVWQIELGSSATPFAPYFTPIELCKIGDYQDYIYENDGKWYVRKEIGKGIYDGSEDENWTSSATYRADIAIPDAVLGSATNNPVLSNRYKAVWATANGNIFLSGLWHGAGIVDSTNMTSIPAWRTYLASNNVEIYYALDTEADTEITNTALIDQLNALKNGGSYTGTTYIKVSATDPNLPGLLKVEAYKYD